MNLPNCSGSSLFMHVLTKYISNPFISLYLSTYSTYITEALLASVVRWWIISVQFSLLLAEVLV